MEGFRIACEAKGCDWHGPAGLAFWHRQTCEHQVRQPYYNWLTREMVTPGHGHSVIGWDPGSDD